MMRFLRGSNRLSLTPIAVGAKAATLLLASLLGGCVATAECDETVGCPEERVCFDYVCRVACETQDECGMDFSCEPCLRDDATGARDHCFGERARACVPTGS